jgi:hypothetical protein
MKLDFCVSHNYTQRENKMQEKNRACAEYTSDHDHFRSRD